MKNIAILFRGPLVSHHVRYSETYRMAFFTFSCIECKKHGEDTNGYMKEKIYTIPVTDAFREECECPLCLLEKKLEDENIEYFLGPSLMEPDGRIVTNENGFCRKHFELLYNSRENRLGLGLIVDTHLVTQNDRLKKLYKGGSGALKSDAGMSFMKGFSVRLGSGQTGGEKFIDKLIEQLDELENKCAICSKLEFTLDRYIDVILYLWFKEEDFRTLFNQKKGFCLRHLKELLKGVKKYLNSRDAAVFTTNLMEMQLENMDRIQNEVNWFTKKFDYRNNDAPWGNSRDALPRSIQKITGYCSLD